VANRSAYVALSLCYILLFLSMSVPELAQLEGGPLELDRRREPVLSPSISKPTVRSSVGLRGRAHRQCYLRKKETAIPIIIDIYCTLNRPTTDTMLASSSHLMPGRPTRQSRIPLEAIHKRPGKRPLYRNFIFMNCRKDLSHIRVVICCPTRIFRDLIDVLLSMLKSVSVSEEA